MRLGCVMMKNERGGMMRLGEQIASHCIGQEIDFMMEEQKKSRELWCISWLLGNFSCKCPSRCVILVHPSIQKNSHKSNPWEQSIDYVSSTCQKLEMVQRNCSLLEAACKPKDENTDWKSDRERSEYGPKLSKVEQDLIPVCGDDRE